MVVTESRHLSKSFIDNFIRLKSLDHPLLKKIHKVQIKPGLIIVCNEEASGTQLLDHLLAIKRPLNEAQIASMASSLLEVIAYLHSNGEAHGTLDLDCIQIVETTDTSVEI